jgi:hypothetical protein
VEVDVSSTFSRRRDHTDRSPGEIVHAMRNVGNGNAAELTRYFVDKDKPFLVVDE